MDLSTEANENQNLIAATLGTSTARGIILAPDVDEPTPKKDAYGCG